MIALLAIGPTSGATGQQTRVVINLSEQRVYLMEGGRASLVAPIASAKPGWSTPTGHFTVFRKDLDKTPPSVARTGRFVHRGMDLLDQGPIYGAAQPD